MTNSNADTHTQIKPKVLYFGTPIALITTTNPDGTTNISPMSSAWALGDRVILGMSSTSRGGENAKRERELVINLATPAIWENVEAIARTTGAASVAPHKQAIGYFHSPDKFQLGNFTPQASTTVRPPRIAECPFQMEASVMAVHGPTDWPAAAPESFAILETKITATHANKDIVVPGTDHIDTDKWSPLFYVFRHYFGTANDLGATFKAER